MRIVLAVSLVLIVITLYLNHTYSLFFDRIGQKDLKNPHSETEILLNPQNEKTIKYLALGDSLTAGVGTNDYKNSYPYKIAEMKSKTTTVQYLNKGIPGATVKDLLPLIPEIINSNPDLITILIGTNDVFNRTPIENFKNDLKELITSLKKENTKIVIMTIPYIATDSSVPLPLNLLYQFQLNRFNNTIKNIAEEENLKLIDLNQITKESFNTSPEYYASDLFHPNEKGYILWSEKILSQL